MYISPLAMTALSKIGCHTLLTLLNMNLTPDSSIRVFSKRNMFTQLITSYFHLFFFLFFLKMHLCSSCVRKREDWLACYTALSSQKALKSKFSIVFVFDKYDLNSLKCIESRIKLGQNIYYIFAFFLPLIFLSV